MDKVKLIDAGISALNVAGLTGTIPTNEVVEIVFKALCKELPYHKDNCSCMSESMAFNWNNYNQLKQWGNE